MKKDSVLNYWHIRADHYDKLFWVRDDKYILDIIKQARLDKKHLLLDIGTGSGVMAKAVMPLVKHVVAIDISEDMLSKGHWGGISLIKWDICEEFFTKNVFDRVLARMVLHHITDDLPGAISHCYNLLKPLGRITIAEGLPPSDGPDIVKWYSDMFKLKEERITFRTNDLARLLKKRGFVSVSNKLHMMYGFNINNWLSNSGLSKSAQEKILDMHLGAPKKLKDAYNMRVVNGQCLVDTKNIIVTGVKPKN